MVHFNIPGFRSHKRIVMLSDEQLDALKQGRAGEELAKRQSRLTPAEIAAMQSELSASAARAVRCFVSDVMAVSMPFFRGDISGIGGK